MADPKEPVVDLGLDLCLTQAEAGPEMNHRREVYTAEGLHVNQDIYADLIPDVEQWRYP